MYGSGLYGSTLYGGGPATQGEPAPTYNGIYLEIGEQPMTYYLKNGTLSKKADLFGKISCQFTLVDKLNALTILTGQAVNMYHLGEWFFSGTVDRAKETFPSMDESSTCKEIAIKCVDWSKLVAKRVVAEAFEAQLAGDMVRDLVTRYLEIEGVTSAGVEDGLLLTKQVFRHKTLSSVLTSIAGLCDHHWYIDEDKDLKFVPWETFDAPFDISEGNRGYQRIAVDRQRGNYRNVQIVKGGKDFITARAREFLGDGETSTFTLESPVGVEPSVEVDGVDQEIGIRGVDGESDENGPQWFWKKGSTGISQNTTADPLTDTQTLRVVYQGLLPILSMTRNDADIAARAAIEGGSGIYESVVEESDIEDEDTAGWLGEKYIRRHARINTEISVTTYNFGIKPGQIQNVVLTKEVLNDDFLITSVSTRERGGAGHLVTTYQAIDNTAPDGWVEFLRKLVGAGAELGAAGDDVANPIGQVGAVVSVSLTDNTAEGDNQDSKDDDPYTRWLITDETPVGCRYTEEGVVYHSGPVIGDFP